MVSAPPCHGEDGGSIPLRVAIMDCSVMVARIAVNDLEWVQFPPIQPNNLG